VPPDNKIEPSNDMTDKFRTGKIDSGDDNYFIEKTGKSIDDLLEDYWKNLLSEI
jgi:hypothetical protein